MTQYWFNQYNSKESMDAHLQVKKPLKLHYFHIRGACQPVRNLLYYLEIDFEDVMHEINRVNEIQVGFNTGLPYLQDGDERIHETIAIMTYICRKYQQPTLIGLTPQSIARIQEVLMKFCMQRKRIISYIFEIFTTLPGKTDKQAFVDSILKKMANECKFLEFCLKSLSKGKKYILDGITLVDFIFYQQCFYIVGFFEQFISKTSIFKFYIEFKNFFQKLSFFEKNREKIEEKHLFHEFNNPEMNRTIIDSWKGAKCGSLLKKQSEA